MQSNRCILPGGYIDANGTLHRQVELALLSGREEELLAAPQLSPAQQVTEVLSRCVKSIGTCAPVTPELARQLLVADRQYLLLMLRRQTFGTRVASTTRCVWPDCREKIDIDFQLDDVPVTRCDNVQAEYRMQYRAPDEESLQIDFRLPNGGDQEAVAAYVQQNPAQALSALLARCVLRIDGRDIDAEAVAALPAAVRQAIEQEMEARAPNVEMIMELSCPECKRSFIAPFDLQDFFFGELQVSVDMLYREIHYLAYHYHWSEQEILQMPRDKRRRYIDILGEEIDRINDASSRY